MIVGSVTIDGVAAANVTITVQDQSKLSCDAGQFAFNNVLIPAVKYLTVHAFKEDCIDAYTVVAIRPNCYFVTVNFQF
jgi:hypothetical protein